MAHAAVYGTPLATALSFTVYCAAAGLAWWGASHQRKRAAAVLVALGVTLHAVGDVGWQIMQLTSAAPDISLACAAFIGSYAVLGLGLWRMAGTRGRSRAEQVEGWIDALVVFVAVLLLVWELSVSATVTDDSLPVFTRTVWTLYPALDAALIGLVFRLVVSRTRGDRAGMAVAGGAACWLVSDLGFLLAGDPNASSLWFDTGWLMGAVLLALATVPHGGGRRQGEASGGEVVSGLGRLAVCLSALLVPAALELFRDFTGGDGAPVAAFGGTLILVALVFLRAALLLRGEAAARSQVRSQQRYSAALAAHSSDAVVVVDGDGRVLSDAGTLVSLLGTPPAVGLAGGELARLLGVDRREAGVVLRRALQAGGTVVDAELACRSAAGPRWISARLVDLREDPDVAGVVVHVTDITDRKRAEEALAHQAFHDALTGLANRALFADRVEQALRRGARGSGWPAVVYIDLDGFKAVNDTLGHSAGDELLQEVARRLLSAVRSQDTVARLGGDEFAVLVEQTGDACDEGVSTAERMLEVLGRPVLLHGQSVLVSGSVGIAVGHADATSDSVVRDADIAMYAAKVAGRGRKVVFDPAMRAAAVAQRQLERELQGALGAGQFRLVYQPVVDLSDERVVGFEALLRWHSPSLGEVAPDRFVPVAEASGVIGEIGEWVLLEACTTAANWRRDHDADLTMAVNVSAVQLASPDLLDHITVALAATGLPPCALVLEVTETALVSDPERAAECLAALRALGVRLALDDFGTGYSSLGYLQQFTVDVLKIDRSFVASIGETEEMPAIVRALIDLGRTLGLEIVAEGVELEEQRTQLRAGRCELAQGYLFAAPLEATDAELLLLGQEPVFRADGRWTPRP